MAIPGNPVGVMDPYSARLASLPQVPRKHVAGDGTEPGGTGTQSIAPEDAQQSSDQQPSTPTLQDVSPQVLFKTVEQLVRSQDRLARNRWAIDTHFDRIRSGVPFSRLEKVPNQSIWVAKLPNGLTKEVAGAVPNKADDLCNKVEDTLMADPPKLIAKPHDTEESTRQAGELATKFLLQNGGESGTNDVETYRWALNNAFSRSASLLHYVVDRTGGGYQPLRKLAHPQATDPQNPMVAMVPAGPPDPMMGQPPMIQERSTNPVLRFVSAPTPQAPAGQFVEQASQADMVWLPALRIERMRREQIRCFPATAKVEDAAALVLIRWMTVSEARTEWPDTVGQMTAAQLSALAAWRPPMSESFVVPYAFRGMADGQTGSSVEEVGSLSPLLQRRMYAYRLYVRSSPEYAQGFFSDVTGANGGQDLGSGTLDYTVMVPNQGQTTRCRDLPVVCIRPMQDVSGGDPLGWPFISRFAGSSEADATLIAAFMDACDNMLHPHVFLRSTASVDEDDWADRTVPILLSPTDPEPTYEKFPTLPPILQLHQEMNTAMDTSSGLTATAQGLDSSNSVSGVAKQLTVRQALVSLSGFQQNLHAGMTRGGRLKCQLVQAEFSIPQLIESTGEGESSEAEWWTGEDFAGAEDRVGLQPGTGTMMTPEGKAQYVAFLQSQQWLTADAAAEVALPGIRNDLGIPEEPVVAALEREVGVWLQGPPQGWVPLWQAYTQQKQAYDAQQAEMQVQQQQAMAAAPVEQAKAQVDTQHKNALALEDHKAGLARQAEAHKASLQPPAPTMRDKVRGMLPQRGAA